MFAYEEKKVQIKERECGKKSENIPVQRLRNKLGLNLEEYKLLLRKTVVLYAELDGNPVGIDGMFSSDTKGHAEENLLKHLESEGKTTGNLVIWLSTSPCSSIFDTRQDGKEGCLEKLEASGFSVKVHYDHLYQPKIIGGKISSEAALAVSTISSDEDKGVAQFKTSNVKATRRKMDFNVR